MTDGLNLSLPKREAPRQRPLRTLHVLLVCVLLIVLIDLAATWARRGGTPRIERTPSALSAERLKQLALKLEKQGLNEGAAAAWRDYLAAPVDAAEAARIWYRIGTLREEAGAHAAALDAYYRSESFARLDELAPEIGRRTAECLEALGKFAALRYELAERVGVQVGTNTVGEDVVAEIGLRKITTAELDRWIEARVDGQLAQVAAHLPERERKQRKEEWLKQFAASAQRLQLVGQLIGEEVLYRYARELNLADDPQVRVLLREQERALLAGRVIERELSQGIKITPSDVNTWYEAHKDEYRQPARVKLSHILVADADAAQAVVARLEKGVAFEALAAELSLDGATAKNGGAIEDWIEQGQSIPDIGPLGDSATSVFAAEPGDVIPAPLTSSMGVHVLKVRQCEASAQKPFDEVRDEVYAGLRALKEREVQEGLFERLKERYDVVIHHARFAGAEDAE